MSDFNEVIDDESSDTYLRWQAEAGLANVYVDEKRPAKSEEYFRRAMATIEAARSSIKREEFRLSLYVGRRQVLMMTTSVSWLHNKS